jgi:hypothetical protein
VNKIPCKEKTLCELTICNDCNRKEKCKHYKYVLAVKTMMEKKIRKEFLSFVCKELGCTGNNKNCPGDGNCNLLKKIVKGL